MKETNSPLRFRSKTALQALRKNLACTLAGTASLAAFLAAAAPPAQAAHHGRHTHGHRLHLDAASQNQPTHRKHHRHSDDETASSNDTRHHSRHHHRDTEVAAAPSHHHRHHHASNADQDSHETRLAELRAKHEERLARLRHRHEAPSETASSGHEARYAAHLRRLAEHEARSGTRFAELRSRHEERLAAIHAHQAAIIARDHALYGGGVVRAAEAFQGTRYVMGGTSRSGFDCSGFVRFILGHSAGVSLPRTALAQYYDGAPVDRANLQAGDLVFFKNTYRHGISHVGIYIGDGRFVHACNPHRGVTVDRLSEAYYVNHYAGARRVMHNRFLGGEYNQDF